MVSLIGEIDEFKGAWQLFGRLRPERLQALKKVATIESIGSSTRIEGSKLTDHQVEELLSNVDAYSFADRDEQEVVGYAKVCEEIFQSFPNIPITEGIIKQLHLWLLKYSEKDQRHRGEYKKLSNNVEAFDSSGKSLGVIFETTSPFDTPGEMEQLVVWTREQFESKSLHPLIIVGIFIVVFLAIHPFQDGNGRLSRILTTLLLLKAGYLYCPYSSLESVIEKNKEGYYLALRRTQTSLKGDKPDYTPWLTFFLRSLQKQKIHLEQKIGREKLLSSQLSPLERTIIELIEQHGELKTAEMEAMTSQSRSTLKKALSDLVANGHLSMLGKGKATRYTLSI